jgi:hypothetical protein
MNATADRRAVLGAVLAGGACLPFPSCVAASISLADPVYAAIERHRQAYDVFMDTWGQTNWATVYDRIKTDEEAAARHRRYCELETAEEEAFHALLATRPTTKAGVIACVEHVADCGLATDEMRAWLAMLVQSPLAS